MNKRNINIELLRILSMLMIVYHHFSIHTHWNFPKELTTRKYFILSVGNFGKGGVILFILITGYFFSRQNITFKKIVRLNNTVTFYALAIFSISLLWLPFDFKRLMSSLFPIIFDEYWFVTIYVLLIIFQPFFKKYLVSIPRNAKLKNWTLLLIFTYVPTLFGIVFQMDRYFIPNNLLIFILAALTGDLLREYKKELSTKFFKLILLGFFISVLILQYRPFLIELFNKHHIIYPEYFINDTKSFTILLFSATFFIIFLKINLSQKLSGFILAISGCTFEIYLIHDNPLLRNYLWNDLFKNGNYYQSSLLPVIALIEPLLVFSVCVLIILCVHFLKGIIKNNLLQKND